MGALKLSSRLALAAGSAACALAAAHPALAQEVVVAGPAAQPPAANARALEELRREIEALRAESVAARAAEQERARRIDSLSRQFEQVSGQPQTPLNTQTSDPAAVIQTAAVDPRTVALPEPGVRATQWGGFEPGKGLILMRSDVGEVDLGLVSYLRYLNQEAIDPTYTNAFGQTSDIVPREDFQLAKVQITLRGWLFDPKFGYNAYVWTSQTSQGLGAQVVAAGNINWTFSEALRLHFGIHSVPSTRTTNRTFPYWLRNDNRPIADEFFRGSYTQGIWAEGKLRPDLEYRVMLANNLSALGVNARQLDARPDTFSAALTWTPTTGEFGPANGFGDFEDHQELATLFSAHYTHSTETPQSQPDTDSIENTQIRLSDGTLIFNPTAFGAGRITEVRYQMTAFDAAFKYQGYALELEYYARWLDALKVEGTLPTTEFFDQGLTVQASAMLIPRTLQLYLSGSQIWGEYGDPYDIALGFNYFPFKRRDLRVNFMALYTKNSPVGYTAYPVPVGANGVTVVTDFALAF